MMCVTGVPACCSHYTAAGWESQQGGENLHRLFTDWSKMAGFVHKMFNLLPGYSRDSSAEPPAGGGRTAEIRAAHR